MSAATKLSAHRSSNSARRLQRRLLFLSLALGLPSAAHAADATYKLGTGPDGFESHALDAGIDVPKASLRFDVGYYQANGQDTRLEQHTGTVRWNVTNKDSISLTGKQIDDEVMLIKGASLGASINLNRFWDGSRSTTLNLGHSRLTYSGETRQRLAAALIDRFPDQHSSSIGISQSLPSDFSLNLNYERYSYSKDPGELAAALAVLFRRFNRTPPTQAFTLAGFPDRSYGAGLSWAANDDISVDANLSQTETVLDQKLRALSLGLNYFYNTMTFGLTVTRSATTEVLGRRGLTAVIPSSQSTYFEFRAGISF